MSDFNRLNMILKFSIFIQFLHLGVCTISGLSFMDPLKRQALQPGEDPCNPLYWYPRPIPEKCFVKPGEPIIPIIPPIPVPIPVPVPMPMPQPLRIGPMIASSDMGPPEPLPFGVPFPHPGQIPPGPFPFPHPSPMQPAPFPFPHPSPMQPAPFPFPHPSPMQPAPFPFPPQPFPFPPSYDDVYYGNGQAGMVPGLPGLVSADGGINILPFSDVYADVLEKHKQKMFRKRLQKMLNKYEGHPWKRGSRRRRNRRRHNHEW